MFTRWGKKLISIQQNVSSSNKYAVLQFPINYNSQAVVEVKNINGTVLYANPVSANQQSFSLLTSLSTGVTNPSNGIVFGSSDVAPTEDDYTIGNIITGISASAPTQTLICDTQNDKYILRNEYTVTNNNASDVTIKEVALVRYIVTSPTKGGTPSTTATNRSSVLLERTVLTAPVTIPAGGTKTIRYDISYQV